MIDAALKQKKGEHPLSDAGQIISLGVFLFIWAGDSFFLHLSTFLSDYVPLYIRLGILGLMLIVALFLIKSGHAVAGHEQLPKHIVTSGAFSYIRHPLYLGTILAYLGLTVSTLSLLSLALLVGIFVFYNFISSYEEKLLEAEFGEEYRKYKRNTQKWVPKFKFMEN